VIGSSKLIYGCDAANFYLKTNQFQYTFEEIVACFPPHFRSILLLEFGFFRYECTFLYTREDLDISSYKF